MNISKIAPAVLTTAMLTLAPTAWSRGLSTDQQTGDNIVHDAEYNRLFEQNGVRWASENGDIERKLAELRDQYGKAPNIIHMMWDDSGYGDVGDPILTLPHGIETPNIAQMADDGLTFTRMYTEPSCTPTRAAILTGRHPIRSGMTKVIFPIHGIGLAAEEVTIAEVLSEAGYNTAFFGKAHQGDIEESYMHNQGFDEALFSTYNQFASQMFNRDGEIIRQTIGYTEEDWDRPEYVLDKEFRYRPEEMVWAIEGRKGELGTKWHSGFSVEEHALFSEVIHERSLNYIAEHADDDKPFYLDYWFHGPNLAQKATMGRDAESARNNAFGDWVEYMDILVEEVLQTVKDAGIEENTLIILMADNGPMKEIFPEEAHQTMFRGGKGSFLEGGVRVPAFAYWPGVIEEGSVAGDIIHASDLFTTFARIGNGLDYVPTDRVIDGVDQTSLLLNGDGHSRRDYVHIYAGAAYAATVKQQFKRHWMSDRPGLVGNAFYDLYKDTREENGMMGPFLWAWEPFDAMRDRHMDLMIEYPNRPPRTGEVFTGLSNFTPSN